MKNKDVLLLENLYQEGIIDRLKGQGAGIKTGASVLGQKFKDKTVSALGGTPQKRSGETAGQAYSKAQQTSLLQSFKKKVEKEIQDFNNDLKSFKVNPDPVQLEKDFPIIAQRLKEIDKLKSFLDNPSASNATPATKTEPDNEISPEFEVLPPEGSDKQQALPSSGEKMALPAPEEKDASKSNEEFLAAREENKKPTSVIPPPPLPIINNKTTAEEIKSEISIRKSALDSYDYGEDLNKKIENEISYLEKELQNRESQIASSQEAPTQGEQPTQPLKPIQPFKYTNGKNYGRDEQGWYQYLPKAKFKKQRISQKSAEVLDAYLKEKEPTGSAKQAQRASETGFRTPAEAKAATTIGDSYNPFTEFLKGYELI
jgi:hypothetical protein